jgi:hypothetical protein
MAYQAETECIESFSIRTIKRNSTLFAHPGLLFVIDSGATGENGTAASGILGTLPTGTARRHAASGSQTLSPSRRTV